MPLYEFQCNQCGENFEKTLRFSEADQLPVCPKCESKNTRKKISKVTSFIAVGSGSSSNIGSSCSTSGSGYT